jgi:hypothetical protein
LDAWDDGWQTGAAIIQSRAETRRVPPPRASPLQGVDADPVAGIPVAGIPVAGIPGGRSQRRRA